LLSIGLGCLQIVLDKGEREDWFASNFIIVFSVIAAVALVAFVIVELRAEHPVVNLRVFKDREFTTGNTLMFTGFFCMFSSIVLLPLYLQKLMGYNALWAGLVLGPGGIATFLLMPVGGVLLKKGWSARTLLAPGLALMAYSIFLMSGFNLSAGFLEVAWPRVVLGAAMGLFFVPLTTVTYTNIAKEEMGNASSIFNLLRNLGGSFGVAFSTTILAQRAQVHQTFLVEKVTPFDPAFQIRYQQIMEWLGANHAHLAERKTVLALMYREVVRQASMLAFNDTFYLLAWLAACLVPLTVLFRKARGEAMPGAMH
jgi:DHA2 family multidrug resistance protein